MIDLNKMAVFSQIIASGSYKRASEVLNVTPSALSQTVSSLEYALGFSLFDRIGKKLIPTKAALKLNEEFTRHHLNLLKTVQALQDSKQKISGVLKIGAYLEFASSKLTYLMKAFLQEYPDIQIKMVFDTPTRLHYLLCQNQLDFCFTIYASHETKMITSKKIYQEELILIGKSQLVPKTMMSFEQIMQMPIIEYYYNHQPIKRWLSLHFQKRPKDLPIRVFAATAEMVFALVKEGVGIGVVPSYLLSSQNEQYGINVCRPTAKNLLDYIWLLEKETKEKSPLQQMFKEKILEYFKA